MRAIKSMGFVAAALLSLSTLPARAERGGDVVDDERGRDGDRGGTRSAPEPLTLAGLALGAGALAAARRRSRKASA